MTPRALAAGTWSLLLLAVLGTYTGVSGYTMAASFSVAHPERLEYWRTAAVWYLMLGGLSGAVALGSTLVLVRRCKSTTG
jgi:hypothetical protein